MLSRVADSLYWMSRYIERAENNARLMKVSLQMLLDGEAVIGRKLMRYWRAVLLATASDELFEKTHREGDAAQIGEFLTTSLLNPDSIYSCIASARENARMIRDQVSEEMWTELNELYLFLKSARARSSFQRAPQDVYDQIVAKSMLFQGITDNTLARGEGWQFIQLGKLLERADKTSRFIDIKHHSEVAGDTPTLDALQWTSILRACSALGSYRSQFGSNIRTDQVLHVLIFSMSFPRSIRFALASLDRILHDLSGSRTGEFTNEAEKRTGSLLARLNFSSVGDIMDVGIHRYIDQLQEELNMIGQSVFETYVLLPTEVNRLVNPLQPSAYFQYQQQQQQQQ